MKPTTLFRHRFTKRLQRLRLNWLWQVILSLLIIVCLPAKASKALDEAMRLPNAYPHYVLGVTPHYIIWRDGSVVPIQAVGPPPSYLRGIADDMGRVRYESFFRKMYGNSEDEVKKNLTIVYWMPSVFGHRYPLPVTTVNGVDKKMRLISQELEKLPKSYYKYLANPVGTFCWRKIANTNRLSTHSFGTTIDINAKYSNYWQWDLQHAGRRISEGAILHYHNRIPERIVRIFEKNGFIWGGRWYHYDTMHFEYRPELA